VIRSALRRLRKAVLSRWGLTLITLAAFAGRVAWWLPPGRSPDGSNSFSPLMPELTSPTLQAYPWDPVLENGFPNPQLARFLEDLPQFGLSAMHLDTWTAQLVWLFGLYLVGAILMVFAAAALFPFLRVHWWPLVVAGIAYQLTPSLMFGLQDSAAYGLQIATYWGLPLLAYLALKGEQTEHWAYPLAIGFTSLLILTEFPASVVPGILFGGFLLLLVLLRRRARAPVRSMAGFVGWSALWVGLFNLWWLGAEVLYRAELESNLTINVPLDLNSPNHLAQLVFLDWAWPPPSAFLTFLTTPAALVGGCLILITAIAGVFAVRRVTGGITVFAMWLASFLLVYGASSPFNGFYEVIFGSSVLANLIRNPDHFVPMFDFLLVALFAVGAEWIANTAIPALRSRMVARSWAPGAHTLAAGPARLRRTSPRFALVPPVAFSLLLIVASWPLVTGEVLEDVNFDGTTVSPVQPFEPGVRVPGYYDAARSWLDTNFPNEETMVFPMPGTWVSGASHLSWGYEGTSAIYETLLAEPLITNDAGTLTSPEFPAIQETYSMAAAGGPPGAATLMKMNSTVYLWSGFANDSVTYQGGIGPNGQGGLNWSVYLGASYGINGHQFTWNVPTSLPSNSSYFGFWVDPQTQGELRFTWAVGSSSVGWYPFSAPLGTWTYVVIPAKTPPEFNYDPQTLSVNAFPTATSFTLQFDPSSAVAPSSGVILLAGFAVYPPAPEGIGYYLAGLGAQLVVVDSSIVATQADPLQSLASYGELLQYLSPFEVNSFGNLTIYRVPDAKSIVSATSSWTEANSYYTAWEQRLPGTSFFVDSHLSWLAPSSSNVSITFTQLSPASFNVKVRSSGPFLLVLLQNFDPLWVASVDGSAISAHFPVDGSANGWEINRSGTYGVSIEFGPVYTYGILIGVSLIGGLVALLGAVPIVRTRLGRIVAHRQQSE
jgi:hypothetical protein